MLLKCEKCTILVLLFRTEAILIVNVVLTPLFGGLLPTLQKLDTPIIELISSSKIKLQILSIGITIR